jgi:LmbE family N-acetylglucosaminyl deacetylase
LKDIKKTATKTAATRKKAIGTTTKVARSAKPVQAMPAKTETALPPRTQLFAFEATGFARAYMVFALLVLLLTTLLWALLGAHIQAGNADQLVNSYLFEHASTFHGATLPGQHTFLLKWPLFLAIKIAGFSAASFTTVTVIAVLLTVCMLVWVIYRIERRPFVFGTICLALASALLLVPAQPYAGGLLPVNMAMLTTRNLEYILYITALVLFVRASRIRSVRFWSAVIAMSLLIASDKLFLTIGVGAAALSLFVYALARRTDLVSFSATWLLGELLASAGGIFALWAINVGGLTHIASQSTAGPYGFIHTTHGFVLGGVYAVLGFLTNLGANPAFDARLVKDIPHQAFLRLDSWGGAAFLVNMLLVAIGVFSAMQLLRASVSRSEWAMSKTDSSSKLSIMMIWTTLVACGVFVASNHYYAVDARYLTIGLFAIFICIATAARKLQWPSRRFVAIGCVIVLTMVGGGVMAFRTYNDEKTALSTVNDRDVRIAKVLAQHRVNVLLGDYWRVIPSRLASDNSLHVMPLSNCSQARDILSSSAWQPDIKTHSFAYLLSFDQKLTDYPVCSLNDIVNAYGKPNASSLIAGTLSKPQELILFYDHGSHNSAPRAPAPAQSVPTVVPITLDQVPYTSCSVPSSMNFVAHEDDDILFMNPDIANDLKAGHCVWTVYLTAGDAGSGSFYWLGRQQGAEAAYSAMLGLPNIWVQRIVKLSENQYITIAKPRDNSQVALIFMNLPDGNLKGQGFRSSGFESLARLESGQIKTINTVDGQSSYTSSELMDTLSLLLHTYQPSEIRTQSNFASKTYPDHSDHMAVGRYVQRVYRDYEAQQYAGQITIPIRYYIGYPVHQMPQNEFGGDLAIETAAFTAYAQYDNAVCISLHPCQFAPVFITYLGREYQASE